VSARRANSRGGFSATWLRTRLRTLLGTAAGARFCVAYSGGLDSTVLLATLAQLRGRAGFELRALHVNHHLQAGADEFARAALLTAQQLQVEVSVLDVKIPLRGQSLEAAARKARYDALRRNLRPGEWLLTAHHQDDQLETVLLQLLRGAGLAGLAAMPATAGFGAGQLLRPLLPVSRAALADYARRRRLNWSEDPSNSDARFDRNFLRQQVLPLLNGRWPAAALTVSRSASHLADAQVLLEELADAQLARAADGAALRISALRILTTPQQRNLLRRWLRSRSLPAPDAGRLGELMAGLLTARRDAAPVLRWPGAEIRRHQGLLYALSPGLPLPQPRAWSWRSERVLLLPGAGRLELDPHPHGELCLTSLPARLAVRFRAGGERLQTIGGRKPLKNLLQELDIPPWQRERLPLLYDGERLIAVAGCWLDSDYRAGEKCKRRARLQFVAADGIDSH
jgi:tRNA(Ile)-lysidine synthase